MFQARLWVQIMRELRQGVRLRKVEHVQLTPLEYELTPFEVLLEDIRLQRFKLNRIMVRNVMFHLVLPCFAKMTKIRLNVNFKSVALKGKS